MSEAKYGLGEMFSVQFVWRLPEGGYLRALFKAEVLAQDNQAQKYFVRLRYLVGGREETAAGETVLPEKMSRVYWERMVQIIGRRVMLGFESADGRSLQMRLTTLTGEHDFFYRFDKIPAN